MRQGGPPVREIDAEDLKVRLERGDPLFLLDVRTPEEYGPWHIDGTFNLPIDDLVTDRPFADLPDDREVVTICSQGNRSRVAAEELTKAGFRAVSLRGGMSAWNSVYEAVAVPLRLPGEGRLVQMRRLGKGCLSYVLISDGQAAVIDPPCRIEKIRPVLRAHEARVTHAIDTHQHADHVSGARRFAAEAGAALYLNAADAYHLRDFTPLDNGATIRVGRVNVTARHAPGHTLGSTLFEVAGQALLTGDTLFVEGVGRPDLRDKARAFAEDLYATYRDRLAPLGDDLLVLPGHYGPDVDFAFGKPIAAPLGELKRRLPLFHASKEEFVAFVTSNLPERPPNTLDIIRINRGEMPCDPAQAEGLEEGPNRCAVPVRPGSAAG